MGLFRLFCAGLMCASLIGCAAPRDEVFVRRGDTLYAIAQKNRVSVRALIEANGLRAPYTLRVRQRLKLPPPRVHVVQKTDTLYNIAGRYGMSVSALARRNKIKPPYTIRIGQELNITPADTAVGAAPSAAPHRAVRKEAIVPPSARSTQFQRPAAGKIIARYGAHNEGVNIAGAKGSPISAAADGTIVYAGGDLKGYGNLILVRHKDGWVTAYGHTDRMLVRKGALVKRGQKIATMGDTGGVKTPQLHFEARYRTKSVNPEKYGVK